MSLILLLVFAFIDTTITFEQTMLESESNLTFVYLASIFIVINRSQFKDLELIHLEFKIRIHYRFGTASF